MIGSYNKMLALAVKLFGRNHINVESFDGLSETVINLSKYSYGGDGYKPSVIRLSYDGKYYWMDIDEYKWEFDDDAGRFEQDVSKYLRACVDGRLVEKGLFFKKLVIINKE